VPLSRPKRFLKSPRRPLKRMGEKRFLKKLYLLKGKRGIKVYLYRACQKPFTKKVPPNKERSGRRAQEREKGERARCPSFQRELPMNRRSHKGGGTSAKNLHKVHLKEKKTALKEAGPAPAAERTGASGARGGGPCD